MSVDSGTDYEWPPEDCLLTVLFWTYRALESRLQKMAKKGMKTNEVLLMGWLGCREGPRPDLSFLGH